MPTPYEFARMWEWGYVDLIVSMVEQELEAQGFSLPREQVGVLVRQFYAAAPMLDLSGPSLLVRKWLCDGMPE